MGTGKEKPVKKKTDFIVRGIDTKKWIKFKIIATKEGLSANEKLRNLIYKEIERKGK